MGAITAALLGGYIVEHSKARYSFLLYALVAFGCAVTAFKINRNIEDTDKQMASMISTGGED